MKNKIRVLLALLYVSFMAVSAAYGQSDTLLSVEGLEFSDGADTSQLMEVPDDLEFSDGQADESLSGDTATVSSAAVDASQGSGDKQSMWGIFIAGLIGGFAAFLMPC